MGGGYGMIAREQRVLLVANCLAEHGDRRLKRLYQFTEVAGVDLARRFLGRHYRQISTLRDREVTWHGFLERLHGLAGGGGVEAVDLFFQLHGEPGRVRFFDQWVSAIHLGREIGEIGKATDAADRLRLVYNLCCYGDSHSAAFLSAGFKTAIGALKVNASAAVEYPLFCRLWAGAGAGAGYKLKLKLKQKATLPVSEALRRADRPLYRLVQDLPARRYFKEVDSTKKLKGNPSITIDSI